jgi:hypothetical protein
VYNLYSRFGIVQATPELDKLVTEEFGTQEGMDAFEAREATIKRSMTPSEKTEYNTHRKACLAQGVEPTFADFRDGAIDSNVLQEMVDKRMQREERKQRITMLYTSRKARAARAGR